MGDSGEYYGDGIRHHNPSMTKKTRNPAARAPLLRKGGRHEKSKSAKRMKDRKTLRSEVEQIERKKPDDV